MGKRRGRRRNERNRNDNACKIINRNNRNRNEKFIYHTKETRQLLPVLFLSLPLPARPLSLSFCLVNGGSTIPPSHFPLPPSPLSVSGTLPLCASLTVLLLLGGRGIPEGLLFLYYVATSVVATGVGWYCPTVPPQYAFSASSSRLRPRALTPRP